MTPRVSAVIPCYNHGHLVGRAVRSIWAQGVADVEVLIVDDGSTSAETIRILSEFPKNEATVLRKENGHLSSARNYGIRHAKGAYILLLDADDFFAPTFLKKAINILDNEPSTGAATCLTQNFGLRNDRPKMKTGGSLPDFLTANPCQASCLVRKTCWEQVGGFDESMKDGYEDWDFWISVTERGWFIRSIPEYLFHYSVAKQSMVVDSDKKRPELIRRLVQNHPESFKEHIELVVFSKELEIQQLQQEINRIRGSTTYRLGRVLTDPMGFASGIMKRLWGQ